MASVKIDTGPVAADAQLENVPPEKWSLLLGARRYFLSVRLPYDCRELLRFVEEGKRMHSSLGYTSLDDFIRRGLELDPDLVYWAIEGLKTIKPEEPIGFDDAVVLGKRGAQPGNRNAAKDKTEDESRNHANRSVGTSETVARTVARLRRDAGADGLARETLARVESGGLSANAAAVLMGWRKNPTPLALLKRDWLRANDEERVAFKSWLADNGEIRRSK